MRSHIKGSITNGFKHYAQVEVRKEMKAHLKKRAEEIGAMTLLVLHNEFGFGEERLKRFWLAYDKQIDELLNRYDLSEEDAVWICKQKLLDMGIDYTKWKEK